MPVAPAVTSVARRTASRPLALACLVAVAVSGCGLVGGGDPSAAAPPVVAVPHDDLTPRAVVNLSAVGTSDVPGGYIVKAVPHGTTLKGHPTIAPCGRSVSSERHRLARRMVSLQTEDDLEMGLYNEVVAYDSEGQATLALRQLKSELNGCPGTRAIQGRAKVTRRASLPVADNAVIASALTWPADKVTLHVYVVCQRHKNALSIVWVQSTKRLPSYATAAAIKLATASGVKLNNL